MVIIIRWMDTSIYQITFQETMKYLMHGNRNGLSWNHCGRLGSLGFNQGIGTMINTFHVTIKRYKVVYNDLVI